MTAREKAVLAELLPRIEHMLSGPKQCFSLSRPEARAVAYALRQSLGLPKVDKEPDHDR